MIRSAAVGLFVSGCGSPVAGPDRFGLFLSRSSDLCAYEDDPSEAPPSTGYVTVGADNPYKPCLDGLVGVMGRLLEHPSYDERLDLHEAYATFFHLDVAPQTLQAGAWLDPLEGVDDCGLVNLGSTGLVSDGEFEWLDAGAVSIGGTWGDTPLTRQPGGLALNYAVVLSDLGIAPAYGESYDWSIDGFDETNAATSSSEPDGWAPFAGIDLPGAITMPERFEITSPSFRPQELFPRTDTELIWTGTSDGTITIEVLFGDVPSYYEMHCLAADDGSFVLPGALLSQPEPGLRVLLWAMRRNDAWIGTTQGRSIHAVATSAHEAWDLITQ